MCVFSLQDDAHVFCTPEQVGAEVDACLAFVREVYTTLGFNDVSYA
jgi:threonyl-tRNA synthetase